MNIYKLPVDAYNRTHEQTISEDAIKDKLVGQKHKEIIDERCQECKKDWTKCGKCPVMMEWVKEHRKEHVESEG